MSDMMDAVAAVDAGEAPAAEAAPPSPELSMPPMRSAGPARRISGIQVVPAAPAPRPAAASSVEPACGDDADCGCGCGGAKKAAAPAVSYVYALGTVTARFPNQSLEQEFRAAWGSTNYSGPISQADLFQVLSQGQNVYIAREMCWVFQVESVDVYLLTPRSYVELSDLILALAPTPGEVSAALIVGTLGPVAPADACNGLQLPVVTCDQVFYFTINAFIDNIVAQAARQGKSVDKPDAYRAFGILSQLADNSGQTPEYRAINYMTFRNLDIYIKETEMHAKGFQLANVMAQPSRLSGTRRIVDVIFIYNNITTNEVQQFFARVDVTGEWPFLLTGIQPYFEHP